MGIDSIEFKCRDGSTKKLNKDKAIAGFLDSLGYFIQDDGLEYHVELADQIINGNEQLKAEYEDYVASGGAHKTKSDYLIYEKGYVKVRTAKALPYVHNGKLFFTFVEGRGHKISKTQSDIIYGLANNENYRGIVQKPEVIPYSNKEWEGLDF